MFSTKSLNEQQSILDVDTEKRTVKAVWASMGNVDLDNDVIMAGAFTKTISERGAKGKNLIWSLVDHNASLKSAFGKPSELYEENGKLIAITKIIDNEVGEDIICLYNEGLINQHSIGFSIPQGKSKIDGKVRYISEVVLYEGSAVLWGANPETPTIGMFKGIEQPLEETPQERIDKLCSLLRKGKLTDETCSLLEIQLKQIQQQIITLAEIKSLEPKTNVDDVVNAIKLFNFKIS